MGMFDDVRCEAPLPDGYEGEYQTKDFDCLLDQYVIRASGRLEVLRYTLVAIEDAEKFGPWFTRSDERWEDVAFHGCFRFYGGSLNDWHEYQAKFTDGQLVEITEMPDSWPGTATGDSGALHDPDFSAGGGSQ